MPRRVSLTASDAASTVSRRAFGAAVGSVRQSSDATANIVMIVNHRA
jgi:hypothetical protein